MCITILYIYEERGGTTMSKYQASTFYKLIKFVFTDDSLFFPDNSFSVPEYHPGYYIAFRHCTFLDSSWL